MIYLIHIGYFNYFLFVFFRKTDKRIEELVLTEREYVKSLNYVITVSIYFNPLFDFVGVWWKKSCFFLDYYYINDRYIS